MCPFSWFFIKHICLRKKKVYFVLISNAIRFTNGSDECNRIYASNNDILYACSVSLSYIRLYALRIKFIAIILYILCSPSKSFFNREFIICESADKDRKVFRQIHTNDVYCIFANKFWFSRKRWNSGVEKKANHFGNLSTFWSRIFIW